MSRIVAALPTSDLLDYASCVIRDLLGDEVDVLYGEEATPSNIDSRLGGLRLFIGVGHGLDCVYTIQDKMEYIEVKSGKCSRNLRLDYFKGSALYLVSCFTGRLLGRELVSRGAPVFLGFNDEYLFYIGDPPCTPASRAVFDAESVGILYLLSGRTAGEAHKARIQAYRRASRMWELPPHSIHPAAPLIVRILNYDSTILTLHGDTNWRLGEPVITHRHSIETPLSALAYILPLLIFYHS